MGRRPSPLRPRKVVINGDQVSYLVRVPESLRKQEGTRSGKKFFAKEGEAKGYCNKLESLLRNYTDKAHGLTDAQKIEAQEAYEKLATVPGARLLPAVDLYLAHLNAQSRTVTLEVTLRS